MNSKRLSVLNAGVIRRFMVRPVTYVLAKALVSCLRNATTDKEATQGYFVRETSRLSSSIKFHRGYRFRSVSSFGFLKVFLHFFGCSISMEGRQSCCPGRLSCPESRQLYCFGHQSQLVQVVSPMIIVCHVCP